APFERTAHGGGTVDRVVLGEDVAVIVDHEAGAGGAALLARKAERRVVGHAARLDEDDARADGLVDAVHGLALRGVARGGSGDDRLTYDGLGLPASDHAGGEQDRSYPEHDHAADHARQELLGANAAAW